MRGGRSVFESSFVDFNLSSSHCQSFSRLQCNLASSRAWRTQSECALVVNLSSPGQLLAVLQQHFGDFCGLEGNDGVTHMNTTASSALNGMKERI